MLGRLPYFRAAVAPLDLSTLRRPLGVQAAVNPLEVWLVYRLLAIHDHLLLFAGPAISCGGLPLVAEFKEYERYYEFDFLGTYLGLSFFDELLCFALEGAKFFFG